MGRPRVTDLRLRFVHRFTDRHGRVRHYFRRPGWPRAPLPGLVGSTEFMAAYQAALAGKRVPFGADRTAPGSIDALAAAYYGSADYAQLARVTKATYRNVLERFRLDHGDKPAGLLKREHVLRFMDARAKTPAAANALLKMLRILMRFAMDRGLRGDDPTIGVRRLRYASDGFRQWTEADILQFEAHWSTGTRARLALALLLYTGQRPGDVSRMGRQHVLGTALAFTQQKTGTRLEVPISAELVAELEHVPAGQLAFVLTEQGRGFSASGFSSWFSERARMAGLPKGCTAHGLRKSAARRLAEAGCTAHQIASITGHRTLKEVERYTRAVDQARLAVTAMGSIVKRDAGGGK